MTFGRLPAQFKPQRVAREDMAGETDNADAAAQRLETALERIASLAGRCTLPPRTGTDALPVAEIAARLDAMIERLRAALDRAS